MRTRALLTLTTLVAGAALSGALTVSPAEAAARVTVENDQGTATVDPTYATTLTVGGKGFQSIKGGHGGIYVFFGTVSGSWQPSKGGKVGTNYKYVPDSESKNNQGFQKFVAFPGSDTGSAANGGTIAANGTWSTSMTIPGAKFKTVDRQGKAVSVDCTQVTCGIITIGAHGVTNSRNESFTPVSFADLYGGKAPTTAAPSATAGAAAAPAAGSTDAPTTTTTKAADAAITVDQATAVVGRVLSFTGSGFTPGEQVVATLDDGRAAVGPLSAGPSGEVAGVLQLPADTTAGTHVLRLSGAASGATPTVNFPVAADPTLASATTDDADGLPTWVVVAFVALAVVLFLGAVTFATLRLRTLRRGRAEQADEATPEAAHAL